MKSASITAIVLCLFCAPKTIFAQEDDKMLGFKAGVNIASIALNQPDKETFRPGVNLGMYYIQPLDKQKVSLQVELYFAQKGGYYKSATRAGSNQLNYLELPVLLRFAHQMNNVYLYAVGGPYLSGLLGGMYLADTAKTNLQIQFQSSDARLEFGLQAGGGIAYQLGKGRIFLDLRYTFGLTNVNANDYTRNRAAVISVGYDIRFRELSNK
ncbi:MAG: PorT family protein [Cytophagales bacterium]|nr:PorT family protein [Cytophagales bacterium]